MKIQKIPRFSSSDDCLDLTAPKAWAELTQQQLRYVYTLMATFSDSAQIKSLMFLRLCGLIPLRRVQGGLRCKVRGHSFKWQYVNIATWQIQSFLHQFNYIDSFEGRGVRLARIQGFSAVDEFLHGVPFIDYLNAEACYQGFVRSHCTERLDKLAAILYRDKRGAMPNGLLLDEVERLAVMAWFAAVKVEFSRQFPSFFRPVSSLSSTDTPMQLFNAQIRALTDGDVTKEEAIRKTDCWRALTELDAKAREAAEFERKFGK